MSERDHEQPDIDMKPIGECTVDELYHEFKKRLGAIGGCLIIAMEVPGEIKNGQVQKIFTADNIGSLATNSQNLRRLQRIIESEEQAWIDSYVDDRARARRGR